MQEEMKASITSIYQNYVESEITSSLQNSIRLTNDLLCLNESEEENMFFDIADLKNIDHKAKKKLLTTYIDKELALIHSIT